MYPHFGCVRHVALCSVVGIACICSVSMPSKRDELESPTIAAAHPHTYEENVRHSYFFDPQTMASGRQTPPIGENALRSIAIVTGNSNPQLAGTVASLLGIDLHSVLVKENASGEVNIKVVEPVIGKDVYVIQSTSSSADIDVNEALLELMFLIRKMKLGYVKKVTAIVPYFAYSRQDRKTDLRTPISSSSVAAMINAMGADRVMTLDLHSGQIQGNFRNTPMDNLQMAHEFACHIRQQPWFVPDQCVIVSPDAGGVGRAKEVADILQVGRIVTIVKRRLEAGTIDTMQTVGEVDNLTCIIVDDMVDTGGTLVKACELLKDMGAKKVIACCTHGIMSEPCCERVNACAALDSLVVSDSIAQDDHALRCSKLVVRSVAPMLALAILQSAKCSSVSKLFNGPALQSDILKNLQM